MLDVVYIQIPILWYDYIPTVHLCQWQEKVLFLFFMDDLCHIQPFAFIRVLSVAVTEGSATNPFVTNRYPIVDIICLIFVEIVFNRLPNVRLLGMDTNPHAPLLVCDYTDNPC